MSIFNIFFKLTFLIIPWFINIQSYEYDLTETFLENNMDLAMKISENLANNFTEEYLNYLESHIESKSLYDLTKQLSAIHSQKDIFRRSISEWNIKDHLFVCTTCRSVVNIISRTFRLENVELNHHETNAHDKVEKIFLDLCARFNFQTNEVCSGLFELNWPFLYYIMMNTLADSRSFCGMLPISFCSIRQDIFNWTVNVDKWIVNTDNSINNNHNHKSDGPINNHTENQQGLLDDMIVVHLSDIHYDPEYKVGSLAECQEPLCCHKKPSIDITDQMLAGYWGDYRDCDIPLHTIQNTFEHILKTHNKIDYIYCTGDIISHQVWLTTKEDNKKQIAKFYDLLADTFKDIQIYPTVGNHEAHPTNVFGSVDVPNDLNINWLYEHLWEYWSRWLPSNTKHTILKGGYYTVTPRPGFRIIVLNNNDCYIFNWWIYYNGKLTSLPQLQWLHDTLYNAEKSNEHVHILMHIPSGSMDCWTVWAREFNRIIERFSKNIGGIFNGHTHNDEFNLHYSSDDRPVAVTWNAGSLTTYSFRNPNYKIYNIQTKTYQVVDYETWIFNLTEANIHGNLSSPNWYKEYQFSQFTNDLTPIGIENLLHRMVKDPNILRLFWEYKITSADSKLLETSDNKNLLNMICQMATTVYNQKKQCNELKTKLLLSLKQEVDSTNNNQTVNNSVKITTNIIIVLIQIVFSQLV